MDSKELLSLITQSFFESKDENVIYLSLSDSLMNNYKDLLDTDVFIIDLKNNDKPLAPFMDILELLKPSRQLLKSSVYALHYDTFVSYMKNGYAVERPEPVIIEEIDYEKVLIRNAIINIIKEIGKGRVVVLNAQLIGEDALEILKQFEDSDLNGKYVFCFNSVDVECLPNNIRKFLNNISARSNYYSINSLEIMDSAGYEEKTDEVIQFDTLIRKLRSFRMFLDLKRGYQIAKKIDAESLLIDFDVQEVRQVNYEMGLISFYNGDTDLASFCLNNVLEYQIDDELDCHALYMLASVSCRKNMNSVAMRYINKALVKSKAFSNSPVFALATMMNYIITERSDSQYSTEKYFNTLALLEKVGFENNKNYTSLIIPYGIIYDKNLRHQMLPQVQAAMESSKKLGNKFGLSTACHWMGIIMTHEGNKTEALEWYQKCFSLREEIGDKSSITKVTNGLSYEYLIDTKYELSYELINNFINNLLDTRDYPEVVITLYNIARTCFFSRNFELADEIFQTILNLMRIFEISDLSVNSFMPEYNDIVIYKATIDFYKGEFTRAKMDLHNVINNGKKFTPIEEFLRFFLQACIYLEEGQKDAAIKVFEKCITDFFAIGLAQEHRIVFMIYEFARQLSTKGYDQDSKAFIQRGFEIARSKDLVYYTMNKDSVTLQDYIQNQKIFSPLKINLAALEEKAEKERLVNQLHRRLRDSQFLNKLVNTHVNNLSDMRFATNTVQSVFDYTMADAVFLAEKNEGNWEMLANALRDQFDKPGTDLWNSIKNSNRDVETKLVEENRWAVFVNLSKFEYVGGMIIYLQKNMQLNSEEMNILNIAASSIQAQLVMLKQNEHLTVISSTDQLSMLNNRRALQEHISVESEMIRRYEKKRNLYMHEAVCFLDLDNFKYYNDTFGHEAGDLLIVCFARLMKKIYRKVDFVARFGGDEFVVLLPNTSCNEAKRAAERLQEGLENASHFVPELERMLGKKLEIPENRILRFSMGICSNADNDDISDLEKAMTKADQALYYSKQHKKGSVTIWSDIKDSEDCGNRTLLDSIKR